MSPPVPVRIGLHPQPSGVVNPGIAACNPRRKDPLPISSIISLRGFVPAIASSLLPSSKLRTRICENGILSPPLVLIPRVTWFFQLSSTLCHLQALGKKLSPLSILSVISLISGAFSPAIMF